MSKQIKKLLITTAIATIAGFTNTASATIVQIQTSYGNIEVNLFDKETPETVENFLAYIDDNAYDNSIIHRSIKGFISQGGGFYFNAENVLTDITEKPSIINEPIFSNICGTIAMAKLGGNPNSATSQWFINLADNSANLDNQNSGFTVFGQVTEAGMLVMNKIAAISTANKGGAYTNIPLENTTGAITPDNAVVIDAISITDTTVDSASAITPTQTTCLTAPITAPIPSSSSGGGSLGYWILSLLIGLGFLRKK